MAEQNNEPLDDEDEMPYGMYKGDKMGTVPAHYLVWLFENDKCSGKVKDYIEENMDFLKLQIKQKK